MKKLLTTLTMILIFTSIIVCSDPKKETEVVPDSDREVYTDIVNNVSIDEKQLGETEEETRPFPEVLDDDFIGGMAVVNVNGKYGFINENRELVIDPVYDKVGAGFVWDLVKVSIEGKWGYIDRDGEVLIELKYDYASEFNEEGFAEVSLNNEYFTIDEFGTRIVEEDDLEDTIEVEEFEYKERKFVVESSDINIKTESVDGTIDEQNMSYSDGRRNIIITKTGDYSYIWNIPISYSGGIKTSMVVLLSQINETITVGIASSDAMLTRESWSDPKTAPIYIERDGAVIKSVSFRKNWEKKLVGNKIIKRITISSGGFVKILEKMENEEKETKKTEPDIKYHVPNIMTVKPDKFVRAQVLNIIDFDIKLDISLIEVRMLGSRKFIQLIGLKNPYKQQAIEYLEDTILYKEIYLETEPDLPDNYREYRYLRYIWTEMPEVGYNEDYRVHTLIQNEVREKLLNYKLIKKGYVLPRSLRDVKLRYQQFFLEAFVKRDRLNDPDEDKDKNKDKNKNDDANENKDKEKKPKTND